MGRYFFILVILSFGLFFCSQKVYAVDTNIVINEISSVGNEWIEFYNKNDIDTTMTGFTIEDNTAKPEKLDSYIVPANSYKTIDGKTDFSFVLNDDGDIITLKFKNDDGSIVTVDRVTFGNWDDGNKFDNALKPILGESIARIPNGQDTNNDKADFVVLKTPSPNAKNELPPLVAVTDLLPTDDRILNNFKVDFSWKDSNSGDIKFKFFLSKNENPEIESIINQTEIEKPEFSWVASDYGTYYWQVISCDGFDEISTKHSSFTISEPVYSSDVMINEVLAHPSNDTDNEFIELHNDGDIPVDLSGWFLDDIDGGSNPYEIENGTIIEPDEYLVFYKSLTKLSLNDSGDWARLIWPNGKVVSNTAYDSYAVLDFAWARDESGNFVWTTQKSPNAKNIIKIPLENAGGTDEEKPVINKIPIKIKTSKVKNYEDMLVEIQGKVVETSGSTFYIDDSSGKAKVYIQAQTEIKKPKMYKGDIFQIFGVVNLYRNVWRVLPRGQSDIKLIQAAKQNLPVAPKPKSVVKVAPVKAASSAKTLARAPTVIEPIIKQVKAAEASLPLSVESNGQVPWWSQIAKLLIGLGLIFMVLLVIKIKSFQTVKITGGHFGDDDT